MSKYYFGQKAYENHKRWGNVFEKPAENSGEARKQDQKTQQAKNNQSSKFGSEMYKMEGEIHQGLVDYKNKLKELENALKKKLKK